MTESTMKEKPQRDENFIIDKSSAGQFARYSIILHGTKNLPIDDVALKETL